MVKQTFLSALTALTSLVSTQAVAQRMNTSAQAENSLVAMVSNHFMGDNPDLVLDHHAYDPATGETVLMMYGVVKQDCLVVLRGEDVNGNRILEPAEVTSGSVTLLAANAEGILCRSDYMLDKQGKHFKLYRAEPVLDTVDLNEIEEPLKRTRKLGEASTIDKAFNTINAAPFSGIPVKGPVFK